MKENFGINDAQELGAVINEAADRHNRQPRGETPIDEDDERVKANDPEKGYITADDLADDAYLSYGEGSEESNEEGVVALNTLTDDDATETGLDAPVDYEIEELNPENNGPIGAASVSAEDAKIHVSREQGEAGEMSDIDANKGLSRETFQDKYELEGEDAEGAPLRAKPLKNLGYGSRKYDRAQTHVSDGRKIAKRHGLRGLIRNIIKPGSN